MTVVETEERMPMRSDLYHRLQIAHQKMPHLRLGQLIINALPNDATVSTDLFYSTDVNLVRAVERYVEKADGL